MKRAFICPYCLRTLEQRFTQGRPVSTFPTRDHVVPKSLGGRITIICCVRCNNQKGDMMPDEWLDCIQVTRPHALDSATRAIAAALRNTPELTLMSRIELMEARA